MDIPSVIELVERLGVPIVVLMFCGWYIKYLQEGFMKEREATEKANDVQRQMLEAAARRPRNRDELAGRLRDGRF